MDELGWIAVSSLLVLGCGDDQSTESQGDSAGVMTTSDGGPTSSGGAASSGAASSEGSTSAPADSSGGSVGSCTPFDGVDDCVAGMFCLATTATEGTCTPTSTMGTNAGDECGPVLYACAEDRLCQPITGGSDICVDMCRRTMGDTDCPAMFTCIDAYDLPEVGACAPA